MISDRATIYALGVTSGEIIAGPYVRAACQRHLNDLERSKSSNWDYYYDEHEASEAIAFVEETLCLNGGQFEGKSFLLLGWEDFCQGNIYGWKRKDNNLRRFRTVYIEGPKGFGKALALDTPIPTVNGWKLMGDIQVGDRVFDEQGQLCNVTVVTPIMEGHDCYRVSFSDGASIVADAQHLWKTWTISTIKSYDHAKPRSYNYPLDWTTWKPNIGSRSPVYHPGDRLKMRTLRDQGLNCAKIGEMFNRSASAIQQQWMRPEKDVKNTLMHTTKEISETLTVRHVKNHVIPATLPLQLPNVTNLPISPYVLGYLLGDGDTCGRGRVACDPQDRAEIMAFFAKDGYTVREYSDYGHFGVSKLLGKWQELNLDQGKYIPPIYMRGSIEQRISLIQGLIDSDGYIDGHGSYRFTNTNKKLIDGLCELVFSVGCVARIYHRKGRIRKGVKGRESWELVISTNTSLARLTRKIKKARKKWKREQVTRYITSCDLIESVPVKCITVDSPSHMYLAGKEMIPTHNSPWAASVGIKGLVADGEERAEVYAAATKRDQALVLFRDACAFYDQSPSLQGRLVASGTGEKRWNLAYPAKHSFFRVISSEKKGQSGVRPSVVLLDEIHEHPDNTVIEMMRAGFKFRREPLMVMITNSGHDKSSVCWEYHELGRKVACEIPGEENDEVFSYICSLDEDDLIDDRYLEDESLWEKVNPSIKHGLPGYGYIRSQVAEARGLPSKMSTVKRLCFCVWTESENPAISREAWSACQDKDYDVEILRGRRCWGGLDLSAVNDLTAFGLMFEPSIEDPIWRLKVWFWVPGKGLHIKEKNDHVPYLAWRDAGYIFTSAGEAISKTQVIRFIYEEVVKYDLMGIAYDRNRMKDLIEFAEKEGIDLDIGKWDKENRKWIFGGNGIKMMPFGQEARSMTPAIDKFELLLLNREFRHDGNPCLTNCSANVIIDSDGDYRRFSKKHSIGRIDGLQVTAMACGIIEEGTKTTGYENLSVEQILERISV